MNSRIDQKTIFEVPDSPKSSISYSKSKDSDFDSRLKSSEKKLQRSDINPISPWSFSQNILFGNLETDLNNNVSESLKVSRTENAGSYDKGRDDALFNHSGKKPEIFGDIPYENRIKSNQDPNPAKNNFEPLPLTNPLVSNVMFLSLKNILIELKNKSLLNVLDVESLSSEIIDRVKMAKIKGRTELNIELNPKELGSVICNISSKGGIVSVNITAQAAAADALNKHLNELSENLKKANISIGNLHITAGSNFDQNSYSQKQNSDTDLILTDNILNENNLFTTFEDSYILSRKLGYFKNISIFEKI